MGDVITTRRIDMNDELLEIATRMAQELQDFIGDAEACGSSLPGTKSLVDEWETAYQKAQPWQEQLANEANDDDMLAIPAFLRQQAD